MQLIDINSILERFPSYDVAEITFIICVEHVLSMSVTFESLCTVLLNIGSSGPMRPIVLWAYEIVTTHEQALFSGARLLSYGSWNCWRFHGVRFSHFAMFFLKYNSAFIFIYIPY